MGLRVLCQIFIGNKNTINDLRKLQRVAGNNGRVSLPIINIILCSVAGEFQQRKPSWERADQVTYQIDQGKSRSIAQHNVSHLWSLWGEVANYGIWRSQEQVPDFRLRLYNNLRRRWNCRMGDLIIPKIKHGIPEGHIQCTAHRHWEWFRQKHRLGGLRVHLFSPKIGAVG